MFVENKLQEEFENNKHLETFQIYFRWEVIVREEERVENNF